MAAQLNDVLAAERVGIPGSVTVRDILDKIGPMSVKHVHQYSGRVYLYNDRRWVTAYDDVYGPNYYQNNESGGTGVNTIAEWEHQGHMIDKGHTLENVRVRGRITDANSIADVELAIIFTQPDTPNRLLVTGLDNDNEDTHTTLWRGMWMTGVASVGDDQPAVTGAVNDSYIRDIGINFDVPEFGDLRIYFKPQSVDPRPDTNTDYFYQSHSWGIRTPVEFT